MLKVYHSSRAIAARVFEKGCSCEPNSEGLLTLNCSEGLYGEELACEDALFWGLRNWLWAWDTGESSISWSEPDKSERPLTVRTLDAKDEALWCASLMLHLESVCFLYRSWDYGPPTGLASGLGVEISPSSDNVRTEVLCSLN